MEKNTGLAYKVLDRIRENPQDWDQHGYFCGTSACFAGTAVLIALGLSSELEYRVWQSQDIANRGSTKEYARKLLGWTPEEAQHVFHNYTDDFTVLEQAVKDVLNGEVS